MSLPRAKYRVRYCARGMDEGRDEDQRAEDRLLADEEERYLQKKYGELPHARLQAVDKYTAGMVLIDRDLLLALPELDDGTLGDVARWAALPYLPVFDPEPGVEEPVQQTSALDTLGAVVIGDPLAAAVSASGSAAVTAGPDGYRQLLADLRAAFPALAARRRR